MAAYQPLTLPAAPINDRVMVRDGFQLVQEAVANWESLDGVAQVDVVEFPYNTSERGYLAQIALHGRSKPVYTQLVLVDSYESIEALPELYEAMFEECLPVPWRDEGWE
ncbi:MAG: hypothetical protein OXE50_05725 [Chloroflexi bacterium]|nr:hypothetical protein [Chloroflexota bacterium]